MTGGSAGKRPHHRIPGGDRLQRRINEHVRNQRDRGNEGRRRAWQGDEKIGDANCAQEDAQAERLGRMQAAGRQGAVGGATHPRVGFALPQLIQNAGARSHQAGAKQCVKQDREVKIPPGREEIAHGNGE